MDKISDHISYDESIRSQTASRNNIDNTPDQAQITNMIAVAEACFEPLRTWWDKPLTISSFFRCAALNDKIGGAKTSQHVQGKAIDIDTGNRADNKKLFDYAKANLKFDQLITEAPDKDGNPSWVHISFDLLHNRNEALRADFIDGKAHYSHV